MASNANECLNEARHVRVSSAAPGAGLKSLELKVLELEAKSTLLRAEIAALSLTFELFCKELKAKDQELVRAKKENSDLIRDYLALLGNLEGKLVLQLQDKTFVGVHKTPSEQLIALAEHVATVRRLSRNTMNKNTLIVVKLGGQKECREMFESAGMNSKVINLFFSEEFDGIVAAFEEQTKRAREDMNRQFEALLSTPSAE